MMKNTIGKLLITAGLLAMAACASTPTEQAEVTGTIVKPRTTGNTNVENAGVLPGTKAEFEQVVGHRVFFDTDQFSLNSQSQAVLARQAAWLKKYPGARIRIEGNCDERGTREYNLALGNRRAASAKSYLTGLGVDPSRITIISYGKERPIDGSSTPNAWSQNRNATSSLMNISS